MRYLAQRMSAGPSRQVRIVVGLGLALATAAAYAGVLDAAFIGLDDPVYVTDNDHVRAGLTLDGLRWAFSTGTASNWHPLTWISHMLDAQLFGLRAWGHHATSAVIHVASSVILLFALDRMTRAFWASAFVAALFALHPLHVESVAWVSERKDVLSTLFLMLVLLAYPRYVERPSPGRYLVVLLLFALGLMCKPMLVTLPFVLLLLDYWPLRRLERGTASRLVREKIPFFVLAAGASLATYLVQERSGAVTPGGAFPLSVRTSNAFASTWRYLATTFWPVDLSASYPHSKRVEYLAAFLGVALVLSVAAVAWRARVRKPYLLVGWLWYLGMLVPVIGIVQVGVQSRADRYTYVPLVGGFLMLAFGARDLLARSRSPATGWVAGALLLALGLATRKQVDIWRDGRTLFEHAIAVTGPNALAQACLGNALLKQGDLDGGILHLTEALRISPDSPDTQNSLGTALGSKGRFEEALPHFRASLRIQPGSAMVHYNLGLALLNLGRADEAIKEFEAALEIEPVLFSARRRLGLVMGAKGKFPEALEQFQQALAIRPTDSEMLRNVARTQTLLGQVEEGVRSYERALRVDPKDLDALTGIAWIRAAHVEAAHRNAREAVLLAERAREVSPKPNAVVFDTLAAAYAEAGRYEEAVTACARALELARAQGQEAERRRYEEHLALFRADKPVYSR